MLSFEPKVLFFGYGNSSQICSIFVNKYILHFYYMISNLNKTYMLIFLQKLKWETKIIDFCIIRE
jgi:hypothetical protein